MKAPAPTPQRVDIPLLAIASIGVTTAVGVLAVRPISDPDAWWNLKAGQYLLATGHFVGPDPWSPFSSHDFVLTEWLGSVIAAVMFDWVGPAGIVWMRTLGVVVLACLMLASARRVADLSTAILVSLACLFAASGSLSERPQTLGLILLMVAVTGWRSAARTLSPPWWLIPLSWIWACSHGYWVFGPMLGLVTLLGCLLEARSWQPVRSLAPAILGMLTAAALTPVGPRLLAMPFRVHSAAGGLIDEWRPAAITDPLTVTVLAGALFVGLAWLYRPAPWWERAHLALAVLTALTYARLTAVAACMLVPLLSGAVQNMKQRDQPSIMRAEKVAMSVCTALILAASALFAGPVSAAPRDTPTKVIDHLAALPKGTVLLDDYNVSSWLLVAAPQTRLVIDSRTEMFASEYLRAYADAWQAKPGWREFVRESGADWALLRADAPLSDALQHRGNWHAVVSDAGYILLRQGHP